MRYRSRFLVLFPTLAVGCGYVGIEDVVLDARDETLSSGGKHGGGSSGDGDMTTGGAPSGSGGNDTGAGGAGLGGAPLLATGGTESGIGGSDGGTGGTWSSSVDIWENPDRMGCAPFCETPNPTFSTHYLFEMNDVPAPGVESNAELSISKEYFNWGAGSLAVDFGSSPASAYIPVDIETGLDGWVHVRAWLHIPSDVVTGDIGLLQFLSGDVVTGHVRTHPDERLSAEAPLGPIARMSASSVYPLDTWFCLRTAVYTDDLEGSITVEANGKVVTELLDVDTRWMIDVNTVNFGVTETGPHQQSGIIYWDSIVIDQDPVACDTQTAGF